MGFIESWPDQLSFKMMPDRYVPVPPCESNVVTPTHAPGVGRFLCTIHMYMFNSMKVSILTFVGFRL